MYPQRQKTYFGKLLEEYLKDREYSEADLERLLYDDGYRISNGLISKYEYGKIKPSADFIVRVAVVLALDEDQATALVEFHMADMIIKFLNDYRDAWKKWEESE